MTLLLYLCLFFSLSNSIAPAIDPNCAYTGCVESGCGGIIDAAPDPDGSCHYLTTNHGTRINDNQNTLKVGSRGPSLLEDFIFREKITHFDHERIPERVVHARGSAAHGYFQVYESLAKYTKAGFLQDPSVKTPVFVRFSTVLGSRGAADTVRDIRGFATKFYTKEGNFDLVANNIPVFFIQDGIKFPDLVHAGKPEPHNEIPTGITAHDNFWDFISLTPEAMHVIMWVLSDRGLPRSFSEMEGFGVHTFRLVNNEGKSVFVKFHWKPLKGIYSLLFDEASTIGGKEPDFHRGNLWDSIEMGDYPEYELGLQILEESELEKIEFDILDATKIWPEEDVPVRKIGKMVLNRNPDNFFDETEQVAFHPGHLVSGIDVTDDPLLQGRLFSYLDTQLLRLGGPNFHEIPINLPIAPVHNTQREGFKRHTIDKGKVNYEPNSLAHGCPMQAPAREGGYVSYPERVSGIKIRERPESFGDHYTQAILFWNSMSEHEKRHIVSAFQVELGKVKYPHIREKMVDHLNHVNHSLAVVVAQKLGVTPPSSDASRNYKKSSPVLSQENNQVSSLVGRKVAIVGVEEAKASDVEEIKKLLTDEYIIPVVIGKTLGTVNGVKVDKNYMIAPSVLFDAVVVVGYSEELKENVVPYVQEAFRHLKPIGAVGKGGLITQATEITDTLPGVVIEERVGTFWKEFKTALQQFRFWEREKAVSWVPQV